MWSLVPYNSVEQELLARETRVDKLSRLSHHSEPLLLSLTNVTSLWCKDSSILSKGLSSCNLFSLFCSSDVCTHRTALERSEESSLVLHFLHKDEDPLCASFNTDGKTVKKTSSLLSRSDGLMKDKCCRGCGQTETFAHCLWQCQLVQPLCGKQYGGSYK